MIVLSCNNISKSYVVENILKDISFSINNGEKVGLVGLNGAGKTTLFKILTNQISKDSGEIYISKDCKIGYLEQSNQILSDKTVFDEALEIFKPLIKMEKDLRDLEEKISIEGSKANSKNLEKLMNKYSRLSENFKEQNGYGYESEIRGVLKGLGFEEKQFNQPINQLSGGQKTRVILAKLLLQKPDLLLLDEPTNHLDLEAINWLERYINEYKGAALIISHDRYFLDATVSKIFHLENSNLEIYNGNYTTYMKKRKKKLELLRKKYEEQQREIKRQEDIIKNLSLGGKRAKRQAKSRQKMLDKVKKMDKPSSESGTVKLRFEPKIKSGTDVLKADNISKSFDTLNLFENINFRVYRGEKVGLIGPNGIGKTTLFNIILGNMKEFKGELSLGHKVNMAYYDQEQSNLNDEKTIVDEIWDENPDFDHYKIRSMLARFLFQGDDIFKDIKDLSGGEKSRVSLLKLMLSEANFLLMDEPTNHLDIDSKEVLEDALSNYDGTLFVISHDRYFLNKVTDKILDLSKDKITEYLGNYDYYIEKKNSLLNKDKDDEPKKTKTQIKAEKRKEKKKLKQQRERKKKIKALEQNISNKEKRVKELEQLMCSPDVFSDPEKSRNLHDETKTLKKEIDNLYEKLILMTE